MTKTMTCGAEIRHTQEEFDEYVKLIEQLGYAQTSDE